MSTLVLDNGANFAKIGYSHEKVSVIPNCQFRSKTSRLKTFTANQLDEIKDPSGLFYILPFQKGYLVNWDVQRKVWDHLFGKDMFKVDFADTNIVITEPYFNFSSIQDTMNEILFEEYQFQSALRINAGSLSAHRYFHENNSELCCIVVDSSFSFTHIVPYCRGRKMKEDRVYTEVRALAPVEYQVSVVLPQNPICYPWEGGKLLAENPDFEEMVVTREDYEENGHYVCEEKFDI
uniref:Actin related protein 6 n=1 Tax=Sinocyclocheilus anshuiensis TaxID=1608454 RepID=A0A671STH6_9TELE